MSGQGEKPRPSGRGVVTRWQAYWRGFLFGFDLFPDPERYLTGYRHKSEAEALRADWEAVGADMWRAIKDFERQHGLRKDGITG